MQPTFSLSRTHGSDTIRTYAELHDRMRQDLREQHPEWINAQSPSPRYETYEARLRWILDLFAERQISNN
jgi:hypothetical protein